MNEDTPEVGYEKPERMSEFFTARLDGYEEHMLTVVGKETYKKLAELVPMNTKRILDLGCGTGLELDEIFKRLPSVSVVGIDITQPMLDKLRQKYPDRDIELICGSYFDVELGENIYDTAVSFQTMHHFLRDEKVGLYARIHKALKQNGVYIEADYIAVDQSDEDEVHAESARIRREMKIPDGEFYHIDIPYTVDNQIAMLKQAGFSSVDVVYQMDNGAIVVAYI